MPWRNTVKVLSKWPVIEGARAHPCKLSVAFAGRGGIG